MCWVVGEKKKKCLPAGRHLQKKNSSREKKTRTKGCYVMFALYSDLHSTWEENNTHLIGEGNSALGRILLENHCETKPLAEVPVCNPIYMGSVRGSICTLHDTVPPQSTSTPSLTIESPLTCLPPSKLKRPEEGGGGLCGRRRWKTMQKLCGKCGKCRKYAETTRSFSRAKKNVEKSWPLRGNE